MKHEQIRHDFLTKSTLAGMAAIAAPLASCAGQENAGPVLAVHLNYRCREYFNI